MSLLREVDVGLLSLKSSHKSHNIPGKIMGYLQTGTPLLGVVNHGNDLVDIVREHEVGFLAEGEDITGLEQFTRELISSASRSDRASLAKRCKELASSMFSVEAAADQIIADTAVEP